MKCFFQLHKSLITGLDHLHSGQEDRTDLCTTRSCLLRHRYILRLLQAILDHPRHPRSIHSIREPDVRALFRRCLGQPCQDLRQRQAERGGDQRRQENKLNR